jgi:anti-sigma B factor antagonist
MQQWRGSSGSLAWTGAKVAGRTEIHLSGEFDLSTLGGARAGLAELLASSDRDVTIDLGGLTFMDTTGLRFLLDTKKSLEVRKVGMVLRDVPPIVMRVLDLTSLASHFDIENGSREPTLFDVAG